MDNKKLTNDFMLVKQLGDQIGYGHLMELASSLWKRKLGGDGSGAFVPTIIDFIIDEHRVNVYENSKFYDSIVKTALEVK